jgi:hypothetical protein
MRERKGPLGRATGIAEGVAAAVRRRQREREPRVLLYDEAGHSRLLRPEAREYGRVLEICDAMVELVSAPADEAAPEEDAPEEDAPEEDAPEEDAER